MGGRIFQKSLYEIKSLFFYINMFRIMVSINWENIKVVNIILKKGKNIEKSPVKFRGEFSPMGAMAISHGQGNLPLVAHWSFQLR